MGDFLNFFNLFDNYGAATPVKYEHGIWEETCLVTYR